MVLDGERGCEVKVSGPNPRILREGEWDLVTFSEVCKYSVEGTTTVIQGFFVKYTTMRRIFVSTKGQRYPRG